VSRLVETELAGTRHREPGQQAPTFVGDRRGELDAALRQLLDGRLDVVAHEEELVTAGVARVARQLAGREREDQPAVARVDGIEAKRVAKERARGIRVFGVTIVCAPAITSCLGLSRPSP